VHGRIRFAYSTKQKGVGGVVSVCRNAEESDRYHSAIPGAYINKRRRAEP